MSAPPKFQTLAVILGASEYPNAPNLAAGPAFLNSAEGFRDYLTSARGLGIPKENLLWLFDDAESPGFLLKNLREFLQKRTRELDSPDPGAENLLLYYVGHGIFVPGGGGQEYCFAVGSTDQGLPGPTSIKSTDLAFVLKDSAALLRRYLVLDCCFAASTFKEFQSAPLTAACEKLQEHLPSNGTAILCSSNAKNVSLVLPDQRRTMFSDALIETLERGDPRRGPKLSISELGRMIQSQLREKHKNEWVRPEVHSPDQREGEIAEVPLFPNLAYTPSSPARPATPYGIEEDEAMTEARQAERLRMELAVARDVQQDLLPRSLNVSFAEITVISEQCRGIGGDFFEAIENVNSLAMVIADVSGKGISAAVLASVLQGMTYALLKRDLALCEVADSLNAYVCSKGSSRYATLILGRLFPDGNLELLNCGHIAPLLISGNSVTPIEGGNFPLGLVPDAQFEAAPKLKLNAGDRVVFLTDGVIEEGDENGEMFGYKRVEAACLAGVRSLEEEFNKFRANRPAIDDYLIAELTFRDPPKPEAQSRPKRWP